VFWNIVTLTLLYVPAASVGTLIAAYSPLGGDGAFNVSQSKSSLLSAMTLAVPLEFVITPYTPSLTVNAVVSYVPATDPDINGSPDEPPQQTSPRISSNWT
jgi:hypothetical protein